MTDVQHLTPHVRLTMTPTPAEGKGSRARNKITACSPCCRGAGRSKGRTRASIYWKEPSGARYGDQRHENLWKLLWARTVSSPYIHTAPVPASRRSPGINNDNPSLSNTMKHLLGSKNYLKFIPTLGNYSVNSNYLSKATMIFLRRGSAHKYRAINKLLLSSTN